MNLKEQVEQDLGLPVGESTSRATALTGEPYLTICIGGICPEGWLIPTCETEKEAIDAYRQSVRGYCQMVTAGRPDGYVLYWRREPEVESNESGQVRVFSRMLISNKAKVKEAA